MRHSTHNFVRARRRQRAFSVVELMLAVSIMGVIIYALYVVFNQTQRAMRAGETQGDVAEKARAISELLTRELQQAVATRLDPRMYPSDTNVNINLVGGEIYGIDPRTQEGDRAEVGERTNRLHRLFFINKETNRWAGIGYAVVNITNGVGVLTRFETNIFGPAPLRSYTAFRGESLRENPVSTNFHHVADGVIHFRVVPFDPNGFVLSYNTTNRHPNYRIGRKWASGQIIDKYSDVKTANEFKTATVQLEQVHSWPKSETHFTFTSNALPAYVEVELGLLEPETLKQYYNMVADKNPNAAGFLERQIARVHLFRQRIPIRTAAP